jgi:hypothetical protein
MAVTNTQANYDMATTVKSFIVQTPEEKSKRSVIR